MNERKTLEERAAMSDIERLRHSCAHVMATAILRIWPDAQFAYGPPVESGFYYDFDMKHRLTPDDFEKIEAEMKKIAKENQKFEKKVISREEAKTMAESGRLGGLTERPGNPSRFKLDLIDKIPEGEEISCYQNGDFIDLCAGPHVNYTSKRKNVRLTRISASWPSTKPAATSPTTRKASSGPSWKTSRCRNVPMPAAPARKSCSGSTGCPKNSPMASMNGLARK